LPPQINPRLSRSDRLHRKTTPPTDVIFTDLTFVPLLKEALAPHLPKVNLRRCREQTLPARALLRNRLAGEP
jgi:hypothetical protein